VAKAKEDEPNDDNESMQCSRNSTEAETTEQLHKAAPVASHDYGQADDETEMQHRSVQIHPTPQLQRKRQVEPAEDEGVEEEDNIDDRIGRKSNDDEDGPSPASEEAHNEAKNEKESVQAEEETEGNEKTEDDEDEDASIEGRSGDVALADTTFKAHDRENLGEANAQEDTKADGSEDSEDSSDSDATGESEEHTNNGITVVADRTAPAVHTTTADNVTHPNKRKEVQSVISQSKKINTGTRSTSLQAEPVLAIPVNNQDIGEK
jgi:hypothetical protein